jgi:hypothetical protein
LQGFYFLFLLSSDCCNPSNLNCQVFSLSVSLSLTLFTCKAGVVLYCLSHTSSPFCSGYFGDGGVSHTICLGWLQTAILLISASQIARITGLTTNAQLFLFLYPPYPIQYCGGNAISFSNVHIWLHDSPVSFIVRSQVSLLFLKSKYFL